MNQSGPANCTIAIAAAHADRACQNAKPTIQLAYGFGRGSRGRKSGIEVLPGDHRARDADVDSGVYNEEFVDDRVDDRGPTLELIGSRSSTGSHRARLMLQHLQQLPEFSD